MCCINLYRFFTIFTWRVRGMPMSSKNSSALYNSQYSNYSDSNTSWTPGEPSEVPLGTSTTTSAIKIGEVSIFLSAGPPPPTLGSGSSFRHPLEIAYHFHIWIFLKIVVRARSGPRGFANANWMHILYTYPSTLSNWKDDFWSRLKSL